MQQTTKLQIYMSSSNTGQQQIELVKASQCLSELGNNIYIFILEFDLIFIYF